MEYRRKKDALPAQTAEVLNVVEALFEKTVLGVYLYGSAVLGGLHPDSDVDILILTDGEMSDCVRKEFTDQLLKISGLVGDRTKRPLEVTVFNQKEIAPWRFPPKYEYMYGEWLRDEIQAGKLPCPRHDPDAAILLWQARMHSVPLKGEKAHFYIPDICIQDIGEAIRLSLPGLLSNLKEDTRNVLLTLSRMWFTLEEKAVCPKDAAADWAGSRLPCGLAQLMKTAGNAYLGIADDCKMGMESQVTELAEYLAVKIENCLKEAGFDFV